MGRSLESSRPILDSTTLASNRASTRFSQYSGAAPSLNSTTSSALDPRSAEIKTWSQSFDRLEDKRLQQQRYVPSAQKDGDMSKLALGAKLERALGRRMSGQDAVFRPRGKLVGEKVVETA
ncbi:MAG: hypothetical protein M1821_004784 [Bathelium mastoideum]|nr:MAG: hypothetical protein M1821_004784 [Bathelium mastoideum]